MLEWGRPDILEKFVGLHRPWEGHEIPPSNDLIKGQIENENGHKNKWHIVQ
jgi:hypothetical protein